MADYEVSTYGDLIDSLISFTRGGGLDVEQRDIRMAARDAYKNLCFDSALPYLLKHHRIQFVAAETGTGLHYDHEAAGNIDGATNATPIVASAKSHGLVDGRVATRRSEGGNTPANNVRDGRVATADTLTMRGSAVIGAYTSG